MSRGNQSSYYSKPITRIHADFKGICALCGEYVELEDASRDHIIPRAAGGGNGPDNIQLTHKQCNNMKGDQVYPTNWQEQLSREMSIPHGYHCQYCSTPITKFHKKNQYVSKIFHNGKLLAIHSWCNKDRLKYGGKF